ncbi:virulence factor SrfC family protein [Rhizobium ruizarguesonis]|uniref:Virulence factor SrfC-like protein n=1 Tax=Rhizobium ruizarguesonis TaxID=2081791 RepID=A0AAE5C4W1_9HYPH|nr:virulence factor SrfC family protein [Rhizobium ruizarguesonis]QIJ44765.1 virulence factor SrfC-like protein [Rhizobium leguminosarum]TCB50272.1 virulence factor SrfC-like protein [Rhizobium leguminosarum bv. viciae]NEI24976.1 virulence factor SrfC-like protein [Rhizobium ruizarguesonis]NEI53068.1 virulence factor SrfC-like protein [Rhizobium ruizarguesonis]TAU15458.1 virulence factor SrfC-like protein [Rhizobium ruizarguesonis]
MQTELKKMCGNALELGQQSLEWITHPANAERVGASRKFAEQQLRKSIVASRKNLEAVERPMCVGVFGPSQAGKSYLVSVLARSKDTPLMARFGDLGRDVDFIREINPGGDRESTGLVTRFSIRQEPSPAGSPVVLRMLSAADVAKVLGNSFFFDGDQKKRPPLKPETVLAVLDAARKRIGAKNVGVTDEDMWDLQDYFEKQFSGLAYIETLSAYWEEAAELAPMLSVRDQAALFSVLWGGVSQFTDLYVRLVSALEQIGYAKVAYCPIDALVPREKSIIDVATLHGLGQSPDDGLAIRSMNGPNVSLPRAVVTALAAELRISITEQPWPFFDHTDLLDFPGARSRQKVDFDTFFEDKPDGLQDLFRRGKVAFLFDRYVAEQEISSILLCIRPSNQEVVELPDMIDRWIQVTHGATPQDRARATTALFLILTMMDQHFTEKAGDEGNDPSDRFRARMGASLTGYFGKAHRWPFEWTPGRPFDNTYWLRNPNFKAEFLIKYEGNDEVEILSDKVEKVSMLRAAYLEVDEVRQHFRDAAKAFDEALRLNDGGVNYLAENLAVACKPDMKFNQIRERVSAVAQEIRRVVSPYFVDSDINKRLEQRQEVSERILAGLSQSWDQNRFGSAIKLLQISQNGISEHLHISYGRRSRAAADAEAAASKPGKPALPGRPKLPGAKPEPTMAANVSSLSVSSRAIARETYLAKAAVGHWTENLLALLRNDEALNTMAIDAETAGELVSELIAGARRSDLESRIAIDLERLAGNAIERPDILLEKAGFFATSHINRFASTLGFDTVPEDKRPRAPDGTDDGMVTVFAKRPNNTNCDGLARVRSNFAYLSLSEWMYAFHQMVIDNVMSGEGFTVNVEQNERLRTIMTGLDNPGSAIGAVR